jgi:DNA-binding MurR/RpiR family transcriptional regulator
LEQVLNLKKGDILIVFDLLLYSREVYDAVSYVGAKLPEVTIATFTNDPLAQIVQYSDLPFFLDLSGQRDFSIISLTAPMCLINALVEKVIAQNPDKAHKALSLYEKEVLAKSSYALSQTINK